jgi:serine/threonine protein kinase
VKSEVAGVESLDIKLKNPRYKLIKKIGQGGLSHVYLALDIEQQRDVALKTLTVDEDWENIDVAIERFRREAYILQKLRHTNIIEFYEYFIEDDTHIIAMEYIEEGSARKFIHDKHQTFTSKQVCQLGMWLVSALTAAHDLGVIHRDIKPSNILLPDGSVRLSDFGIASLKENQDTRITGNLIPGTVKYMSPERLQWEDATEASDIWSLGIVFYEMLVGYPPFEGQTAQEIAHAIRHNPLPPVEGEAQNVWPDLASIISGMLRKTPEARYPSMRTIGAELDKAMRREGGEPEKLITTLQRVLPPRPAEQPDNGHSLTGPVAPETIWGGSNHDEPYTLEYNNSIALIIAPGQYQQHNIRDTPNTVNGAKAFARLINARYNFELRMMTGKKVVYQNVLRALNGLQHCHRNDRVIIYWSGAARTRRDRFGRDQTFLAGYDTVWDDNNTFIPLELLTDIRFIPAKHVLFIFDAPTQGPVDVALHPGDTFDIETAMHQDALHVLCPGTRRPANNDNRWTLFTQVLLEGLNGSAIQDDILSADTLGMYMAQRLYALTDGKQQMVHARVNGGEKGTMVFQIPLRAYLPHEAILGVNSQHANIRLSMVQVLSDFAQMPGSKVQEAALEQLQYMARHDTSKSIRDAAAAAMQELMTGSGGSSIIDDHSTDTM